MKQQKTLIQIKSTTENKETINKPKITKATKNKTIKITKKRRTTKKTKNRMKEQKQYANQE